MENKEQQQQTTDLKRMVDAWQEYSTQEWLAAAKQAGLNFPVFTKVGKDYYKFFSPWQGVEVNFMSGLKSIKHTVDANGQVLALAHFETMIRLGLPPITESSFQSRMLDTFVNIMQNPLTPKDENNE